MGAVNSTASSWNGFTLAERLEDWLEGNHAFPQLPPAVRMPPSC